MILCLSALPARAGSLYSGPPPRPGPALLYEPVAKAPQLENAPGSIWHAAPILVSGATAYRDGEFLYQDWLYDDHGARETQAAPLRQDPGTQGSAFALPNGTYTYPTGPGYDEDAADLVEFRCKPLRGATAFRITLNTLENPSLVAFTIALGGTSGHDVAWPDDANVVAPAALFLTVHGTTAQLLNASGHPVGGAPASVSVDILRHQFTVLLPHADFNPTGRTVRMAMGVGLWNSATGTYLLPQARETATEPGGSGGVPHPAAFFNVAFRSNAEEPMPNVDVVKSPDAITDPAWWRDYAQGAALARGNISEFYADVNFRKLAARVTDNSGVPKSGPMDRILASHFSAGQGVDYSVSCSSEIRCHGEYPGNLQPYAIYVPPGRAPKRGFGLQLLLHSLDANYNQFEGTRNQSEFSKRGPGYIVVTPEQRGEDGWDYDWAAADVWEVWADVAAHYHLDPDLADIAGYSMGGYGTYKFAAQFPDLFARGQPTVGPPDLSAADPTSDPGNVIPMLDSLRNVPFLIWNATSDELVPFANAQATADAFDALGYRYEFDAFAPAEHLTLAINDQYARAAAFLGSHPVDRNPPQVTYTYNPSMDFPADGTAAGHAYWVSSLHVRDGSSDNGLGTIDVFSQGFGVGDPTASGRALGAGTMTGGNLPALGYVSQTQTWSPTPSAPIADRLDITATNISAVTITPSRARVNCHVTLHVTTDGPLQVSLLGCPRGPANFGAGTTTGRYP